MSADDLMCEGIEYLTEGNYTEALNYFEKSLEIDQNLPECNYYKGLTNQLLSKFEISLESFDIELSLNANHINSLIAKGTSLCLLSRKEEGIKEYNKVLELEPNNIQALLNKSIALHDLNKTDEALDCINKLIEIDNNNYLPYLTKGNILAKNGQNAEAIENYKLSLEKNNISTQALYNMGICYLNMKDYQQANKCFDDALLINPNLLEIYIAKAKIFEEQKNYNNAIELYNEIIPKFPYDDNIFYKKGICLENMEEYQEALKNFEQGLDINKSNIDCLYHKGYCCDILNNKKQALKCYDDIIKSKEKNIDNKIKEDCLILKSKILIDDEKYDDALQGLNEALRLNPDNSYIYFYKGFINNKKGEHQEALNNYLKSIEINNKDKIIYYNLGLAYLEISDFEKSLNYLNKSFELDNTFYQALIKSGEVLLKSNEYDKSIDKTGKYRISYSENINNIYPIRVIFESENGEKNLLFSQYDDKLKKTSYFLNYKFPESIIESLSDKKNSDSQLFIFVLDQSGSMEGTPINLVKKSLKIFLHSLPKNSYFQLIGFGSEYKKYNETPIKYSYENITNLDNLINNLDAEMGGTYPLPLIKNILENNKDYINFKSNKNLFILTDGEVEEREETLDYIKKNKKDFKIHSIGYGSDFDKDFIQTIGSLSECTYSFVSDINEINAKIISILELCGKKCIKNIKINMSQEEQASLEYNNSISNFFADNLLNYGCITVSHASEIIKINIKYQIDDKLDEINLNFDKDNIIKIKDGSILNKIIISNLLNSNNGNNSIDEKTCLELSTTYQVLSKYTALYAEIINYGDKNQNGIIPLTFIHSGTNYICNNFRVNKPKIHTPKTGKHGHAKTYITYTDPITGKTYEDVKMNNYQIPNIQIKQKQKKRGGLMNKNYDYNFDLNDIVLTQDLMEGFWDSNDNTIKIVNEIKDIYDKADTIINKLVSNDNDELKRKILFTFIIIYFIENNATETIAEFKLIIEKGKNFLKNNNIEYDSIYTNLIN